MPPTKERVKILYNLYRQKPTNSEQGTSNTAEQHVQPRQSDSGANVQQNPETSNENTDYSYPWEKDATTPPRKIFEVRKSTIGIQKV